MPSGEIIFTFTGPTVGAGGAVASALPLFNEGLSPSKVPNQTFGTEEKTCVLMLTCVEAVCGPSAGAAMIARSAGSDVSIF